MARNWPRSPRPAPPADLIERIRREPVTLLYAARDETRNNAVVLNNWLQAKLQTRNKKAVKR